VRITVISATAKRSNVGGISSDAVVIHRPFQSMPFLPTARRPRAVAQAILPRTTAAIVTAKIGVLNSASRIADGEPNQTVKFASASTPKTALHAGFSADRAIRDSISVSATTSTNSNSTTNGWAVAHGVRTAIPANATMRMGAMLAAICRLSAPSRVWATIKTPICLRERPSAGLAQRRHAYAPILRAITSIIIF
jgi:hypothetical protein